MFYESPCRFHVHGLLLLSFIFIFSSISLAFVFSTTYHPDTPYSLFFKKQVFGVLSGIGIYFLISRTDAFSLMRWGFFAYFGVLVLLLYTIIKGKIGMGAQRWIDLGIVRMQPSELTKLFFPPFATYYIYSAHESLPSWNKATFAPLLAILGISFVLVAKQPDLGTGLLLLCSGLVTLWIAGIPTRFFIYTFTALLPLFPLVWHGVLHDYQKQRVLVFLGYGSVQKERYHLEQSLIAIGSGGLKGKGFLQGTQNRFQFLPESRTDCIFSIIAEELGFAGTATLALLYLLFFLYLLHYVRTAPPLMHALSVGLITHIMLSTLINIGMVMGLVPMVGVPLPLVSYGISNLWVTYASLGWLRSISLYHPYKHA